MVTARWCCVTSTRRRMISRVLTAMWEARTISMSPVLFPNLSLILNSSFDTSHWLINFSRWFQPDPLLSQAVCPLVSFLMSFENCEWTWIWSWIKCLLSHVLGASYVNGWTTITFRRAQNTGTYPRMPCYHALFIIQRKHIIGDSKDITVTDAKYMIWALAPEKGSDFFYPKHTAVLFALCFTTIHEEWVLLWPWIEIA